LHLKPLVDADLRYPAVLVFPSWEKTLENNDPKTQDAISQLVVDVLSHLLGENVATLDEIVDYADRKAEQFLTVADAHHLFVAPGGPIDEPLADALARYQAHVDTWRSQDWLAAYKSTPLHRRVLNGIVERLGPVYHLLENAEEIAGIPLMCLDQHAHYYKLVAATNSARLEKLGMLDGRTRVLVDAMGSRRLSWLNRVPLEALVGLRKDNANVTFRARLFDAVGRLHQSRLREIDKVAAEICHEIASAIMDHEKEQQRVEKKYSRLHARTLIGAVAGAAVTFIPSLAPFLGSVVPFVAATKYGSDKLNELEEKHLLTRSLMGVLAAARSRGSEG
jgi:acyl carrier protein phosphodiesterase